MGGETLRSPGRQRALCILGMHRSGTSAVTRAFNLLGAFVGEDRDLMREAPANPEGYWERNDLYVFHERLLAAVKRRWDTGLMLPDGWHRSSELGPYREELAGIVSSAFAGRPFWAWKDPRCCILLELWKDILGGLGVGLDAVLVVRHPRDVAASLSKRDGFGLEKSWGIWFCHNLAAVRSLEGVRAALITYDRFLEDPAGQVRRVAAALDLPGPEKPDEAFAAIGRSVRKDLCHSLTAADPVDLPAPVRDLHALIRQAEETTPWCGDFLFEGIRRLYGEYLAYAGFFRDDLERCLAEAGRLDGLEAREADARAARAESRALTAEEQARDLERQRLELARAFEQVVSSRIWRLTGPARRAADLTREAVRFGKRLVK